MAVVLARARLEGTVSTPLFATGDLVVLKPIRHAMCGPDAEDSILMLRDGVDVEVNCAWLMVRCGSVGLVMSSYVTPLSDGMAYVVQFGPDRVTSVFESELEPA